MTTPYRKAAKVKEPRVRYGWRLTDKSKRWARVMAALFGCWLSIFAGVTVLQQADAIEFGVMSLALFGAGFFFILAMDLASPSTHEERKPFFERYEKP